MSTASRRVGQSRRNHTAGPPLTQVGGKPIVRGSSNDDMLKEKKNQSQKPEPATDDEPLSSSEEESEKEESKEREEEENHQRESEVAKEVRQEGAAKRKRDEGKNNNPPSSSQADDKDAWFDRISSQRSRNSSSQAKYGEFKMPRDFDAEKGSDAFLSPRNIDVPPTPRKAQKRTNGSTANSSKNKEEIAFRMPAAFEEDLYDRLSSPVNQFKDPPGQSLTSVPSSAFTAREFDLDFDDDLSSLSSPPSSLSEDDKTPSKSLCPNCNAPVDSDLLGEYLVQPHRRLRDDRLFCESHKVNKAEKEWTNNKYPTIDWDTFDQRVRDHLPEFERLLVPNPTTFFRGRFESTLKDGQAKVFKMSLEDDSVERLSCGYYGPKGASKMLNYVTSKYSGKLRQLAATDKVIKAAGAAAYAQAVLVPELTVLLIKKDMNVDSQDARQILRTSTDIGNRLNPADNDQIHVNEDDENNHDNNYT
ncbi:conserved hypothetical protein [Talaromyces stipitatus ATCC 10500]|uniref:Restriction of telomere capping protein 4 n=1 Tax=Talaromyces stipitatus (strain ATCC 10500 / CBS 375.48 / QM 6759 / NRRL 1006) TaxID=441959 RepID=B8MFF7_TALSN|nr:uncharacterized protein TSTA_017650 [Talaromyces stipitatus ATCC 10500]EED16691.1 conserved hypothetical protein [Talaromyces stipitatus ATCC 10500]